MYIPKFFKMKDEKIIDFMKAYSFATVISGVNGQLNASQLPLIYEPSEHVLYGHFARANSQWKGLNQQQVLVLFQGPHSYISPQWYETTDAVPTWNYTAVHVKGTLEIIQDEQIIDEKLHQLIHKYEPKTSKYHYEDVDPAYIASEKKGIVSFKITIESIDAKAKLNQHHPKQRQQQVIEELKKSNDRDSMEIAKLMEENQN